MSHFLSYISCYTSACFSQKSNMGIMPIKCCSSTNLTRFLLFMSLYNPCVPVEKKSRLFMGESLVFGALTNYIRFLQPQSYMNVYKYIFFSHSVFIFLRLSTDVFQIERSLHKKHESRRVEADMLSERGNRLRRSGKILLPTFQKGEV